MRKLALASLAGAFVVTVLAWRPAAGVQVSLDPLVVDPQHYTLEFENAFVQVIRCRIPPHDKVKMHQHSTSSIVVLLTDQHLRQTFPDGTTREVRNPAGRVSWGEPQTHMGENLSDQPYEYVRVDIKAAKR